MAFNGLHYFVFLPVLLCFYYAFKQPAARKAILLAGSAFFMIYNSWLSATAVFFITVLNYRLLSTLNGASNDGFRKRLVLCGVVFNASLLLVYKFLQVGAGEQILNGFDNERWIILGISFYSLQLISFYVEVYKRRLPFFGSFPDFLLSVVFFAKVPAGPILSMEQSLSLPNSVDNRTTAADISFGLQRLLLGLFKKVALADRLTPYVSEVFDKHQYLNGATIYLAPFLFTVQVYFDFSGYIDMAIGSARLFGIRLPENFDLPLRATSITKFWRRWHMTLINWLSTYVFYPVAFRFRKWKKRGLAVAVLVTFLISAFWHGMAFTFLVWGLLHVLYIIIENRFFSKKKANTWWRMAGGLVLTWHLVAFANLFFRANTLKEAFLLFRNLGELPFLYSNVSFGTWLINGGGDIEMAFNYRLSVALALVFLLIEKKINRYAASERYNIVFVTLLLTALAVFGMYQSGERFIYLQF
jgi:D-alanyl-lipoteichoic acid acyltransferase DltB (MBOAT superfamily)